MGYSYQELKGLGKNSVVLEKQENIEIKQNSTSYCSKKRTLIKERFYKDNKKYTQNVGKCIAKNENKLKSPKDSEVLPKVWLHTLALEKQENKRFEQKVKKTSMHLDNLKQNINHEIEKLQKQHDKLISEMKAERKECEKNDITWAENLANNCYSRERKNKNIAREKFSLKHQGVSTSPRYGSNQDVALRPRTRTVASQIDTRNICRDKGAVGDHNSLNCFEHNKIQEPFKDINDDLVTPSIHRQENLIANYCCNHTLHPVNECYSTARDAREVICHQQHYQQSSVQPHREYQYCCDEYYYDYGPCIPQPTTCCCAASTNNNKHTNTRSSKAFYGRHGTDLNTQEFCCRSSSKPKKETAASRPKRPETCEEYGKRKESECKKKQHKKREQSKNKINKDLKNQNSCHDTTSKLIKHLDRYADEHKKHLDAFLKKHKHLAQKFPDDSLTTTTGTTTVRISSESEVCRITVQKEQNNDTSLESQYSIETLRMFKKMKIRKYVPAKKTATTEKDNEKGKEKRYQEYLEKYTREKQKNNLEKALDQNVKILMEPPKVFEEPESEKLLQQEQIIKEKPHIRESIDQIRPQKQRKAQEANSNEDLRYEYGLGRTESIEPVRDYQELVSKPSDKQDNKSYRVNKDTDQESQGKESAKRASEDHKREFDAAREKKLLGNKYFQPDDLAYKEKPHKYRGSIDYVREPNNQNNLQGDRMRKASYESNKTYEILSQKLEPNTRKEPSRETYREPTMKHMTEREKYQKAQNTEPIKDKTQPNYEEDKRFSLSKEKITKQNPENPPRDSHQQSYTLAKDADSCSVLEQNKSPELSVSSYTNFKATMDYTIGLHVARSSQTDYIDENALTQSNSNKTFTKETKQEDNIHVPKNTEEALQYLKNFLNFYQEYNLKDECLNSVTSAAKDLIETLSSCKRIPKEDSQIYPEQRKLSQDKSTITLEEKITNGTQYKDPESTPNTSRPRLENEDEFIMTHDGNDEINTSLEKVPSLKATPTYSCFDQEVYQYKSHSDNQHWQTEEDYQRYLEYKQYMATSLKPPADFIDDVHYQDSNVTQMTNGSQCLENILELPLTYDNAYEDVYHAEDTTNFPLSSYENEYYVSLRPETRSINTDDHPSCSTEILPPIKGILKPCRTTTNSENICYDLVTKRIVSTVSFGHEDHQLNMPRDNLLGYTQEQEQTEHQRNECLSTITANDTYLQAVADGPATTSRQLSYEARPHNENVANCDEENNRRFLYTVEMPNFKQCPCMLDTYMEMLKTYYRGGNK